jgi:hypothetical protein
VEAGQRVALVSAHQGVPAGTEGFVLGYYRSSLAEQTVVSFSGEVRAVPLALLELPPDPAGTQRDVDDHPTVRDPSPEGLPAVEPSADRVDASRRSSFTGAFHRAE